MKHSVVLVFAVTTALPLAAEAGPPVIQSGSVWTGPREQWQRVILKQTETTPAFGLAVTDSIVDSESCIFAMVMEHRHLQHLAVGSTATFAITVDQNYTVGSLATLAEAPLIYARRTSSDADAGGRPRAVMR